MTTRRPKSNNSEILNEKSSNESRTVVLIPHYNNLKGLYKSIKSINHPKKIDVLVVDDGSNETHLPCTERLNEVVSDKINVRLKKLKKNKGISVALNEGLKDITTEGNHEFIARLDAGDTCVANRFYLQERYLDENNKTALVGSWVKWIDDKADEVFKFKPACDHKKIKRNMSIRCNFIHPTVMYRTSIVEEIGQYPDNFQAAEDYAYFFAITNRYETANIPKYLTCVDYNEDGISSTNRKEQNLSKLKIINTFGKFNFYRIYGNLFNVLLLIAPSRLVFLLKKKVL